MRAELGPVTIARALWGAALLAQPGRTLHAISGRATTPAGIRLLRVLGARHLLQSAVSYRRPTAPVLAASAVVDALHAASCAAFAALDPKWRRASTVDGCAATAFCLATAASAARNHR